MPTAPSCDKLPYTKQDNNQKNAKKEKKTHKRIPHNTHIHRKKVGCIVQVNHSLVEALDALLVDGDAVMRPLRPADDEVGDLSAAEAHPGGELDLHVVGLLLEGTGEQSGQGVCVYASGGKWIGLEPQATGLHYLGTGSEEVQAPFRVQEEHVRVGLIVANHGLECVDL